MVVTDATHQLYRLIDNSECIDDRYKFMNCVKKFINQGANINVMAPRGYTILMCACRRGMHELAIFIIKSGAKLDLQNAFRMTALMIACSYAYTMDSIQCAQVLIDAGCDVDIQDGQGQTALMRLIKNENICQFWHHTFINLVRVSQTSITDIRGQTVYDIYFSTVLIKIMALDDKFEYETEKIKYGTDNDFVHETDNEIDYKMFLCHNFHDKIILSYDELNLLMGKMRVGQNIKSAQYT